MSEFWKVNLIKHFINQNMHIYINISFEEKNGETNKCAKHKTSQKLNAILFIKRELYEILAWFELYANSAQLSKNSWNSISVKLFFYFSE